MQALDNLSRNLHVLVQEFNALREENATLRGEQERLRAELVQAHGDLVALQQQNKRLATVNVLTMAESREEALKRINALIAQVDRAIAALNR